MPYMKGGDTAKLLNPSFLCFFIAWRLENGIFRTLVIACNVQLVKHTSPARNTHYVWEDALTPTCWRHDLTRAAKGRQHAQPTYTQKKCGRKRARTRVYRCLSRLFQPRGQPCNAGCFLNQSHFSRRRSPSPYFQHLHAARSFPTRCLELLYGPPLCDISQGSKECTGC